MKKQQNGKKQNKPVNSSIEPEGNQNVFKKFWNWRKERKRKLEEKRKKPQTFTESLLSWTKTILGAILVVMIINGLAIASFVVPTGSMENTVMTGDFLFVDKFSYGPSTPQVIPFVDVPLPFLRFPGIKEPEKGDVIVFIYPGNANEVESEKFTYYLKRCVATAGDTVVVRDTNLFVNGEKVALAPHGKFLKNNRQNHHRIQRVRNDYGPKRIPKAGDTIRISMANFINWNIFIQREGHNTKLRGSDIYIDNKKTDYYVVERDYCFGMGDNRDNSSDSRVWGFIPVENVVGTPIMVYWSWQTKERPDDDEWSLWEKISNIRWGRLGTLID